MPVSSRTSPAGTEPDRLRPYAFHGVHLAASGGHAVGDCPFCGREGKFSVDTATGLWRCFVCGAGTSAGGGNGLVFTRLIWENATAAVLGDLNGNPAFLASVAADRKLLSYRTAAAWGVRPARDGTWLVPGYGADGKLDQVYRRVSVKDGGGQSWRLLPTPGIWPEGKVHALHLPAEDFDPARPCIVVCEGPWDGMALWEVWNREARDTNIVAVPGCNVWRDEWTELCRGKLVTLLFDSDHPRQITFAAGMPNSRRSRAGYDGMVRIAERLSGRAASVRWVRWGPDGYDLDRPSGWDVRDHLTSGDKSDPSRTVALTDLLAKVEDVPREHFNPVAPTVNGYAKHDGSAEALPCSQFGECEKAWVDSHRWRRELSDALAVLLAVAASTQQAGNQLFLDLIGSPGSAKTTMCKGLLVSGHCIPLENVTKLLSGWKKPGETDKDCSFLARANGKTWVTCEFDTLATSPQYHELMGKVRRIFDGETSATYGNSDEDRRYAALRTPWIRAGTQKMVDHDQSALGDRFLRFSITDPPEAEKRAIVLAAIDCEDAAMVDSANGMATSIVDRKTRRAQSLTGGYVDWLRSHIEEKLPEVTADDRAKAMCADLAELTADLRARPVWDEHRKSPSEIPSGKELGTRLARQFYRMARCLAVVLNKTSVDADVLRIVRKVALDTAAGNSLNMVHWLCTPNPRADHKLYQETGGLSVQTVEQWTSLSRERANKYLNFMRKIGVVEWREVRQSLGAWVLTDRVYELYLNVMRV